MVNIQLDELNEFILSKCKEDSFNGFTTVSKIDINNNTYELKNDEQKYIFLVEILGNRIFASEDCMLECLLKDHINAIENREIYEHGYPEARLIPHNHTQDCEEESFNFITGEFNDKIKNILNQYFIEGV